MLRAISPVIAIIILVAVTIAIAVAVAGWMMGLWTGFTAKPALSITDAVLYLGSSEGNATMIVTNSGQGDADIYSIRIGGYECTIENILSADSNDVKCTSIKTGNTCVYTTNKKVIIKAGDTVRLSVNCTQWNSQHFTPGTSEQIVIFTKDGSKFVGTIQIQSG